MEEKTAQEQAGRELGRKQRYVLIGAGLGLYYGIFYRPTGVAPDYGIAIVLSIFAALVTVIIRFWNKKPPFSVIAQSFFWMFFFFAALLLMLAARNQVEQIGGRTLVALFTTLICAGLAYLLAIRKIPL